MLGNLSLQRDIPSGGMGASKILMLPATQLEDIAVGHHLLDSDNKYRGARVVLGQQAVAFHFLNEC